MSAKQKYLKEKRKNHSGFNENEIKCEEKKYECLTSGKISLCEYREQKNKAMNTKVEITVIQMTSNWNESNKLIELKSLYAQVAILNMSNRLLDEIDVARMRYAKIRRRL